MDVSDVSIEGINISKKFRKGESFNSLRDLIPALMGQALKRASGDRLEKKEFWALKDLSFQVGRGEALGVIGNNGAGKSTLLKVLCGIMKPTTGCLKVNGKLSTLIEVGAGFHPDLTGRENIFLNGVILGMSKSEIRRKFDEIVDFSGLGEFIDTPVKRYSSGMYARLGFSVAAHVDPEILLVDEVLSVGDWTFQNKGAQKMEQLIKGGATVVFVSHNLRAVAKLCNRCILLEHGKIVMNGPSEEIIGYYLNPKLEGSTAEISQSKVRILGMTVIKSGDEKERVNTGEKVLVKVTVRSQTRCNDLSLHLYIRDANFYIVFQTSTYLLGYEDICLIEGEEKEFCIELSMHLGTGLYYIGAVARSKFDMDSGQYDRKFPGSDGLCRCTGEYQWAG